MSQEMGQLVTAFHPIISLLWPYACGFIGFSCCSDGASAESKIQSCPYPGLFNFFNTAVRLNGRSGSVSGNSMKRPLM